jgi:hypothetical protein
MVLPHKGVNMTHHGHQTQQKTHGMKNPTDSDAQRDQATGNGKAGKREEPLAQECIAERAKAIWKAKGCPQGQDEQNWRQAESELAQEQHSA